MGCPLSRGSAESNTNLAATNNRSATPNSGGKSPGGPQTNGGGGGGGGEAAKQLDPRLPLNVRQKFNLTKSWKGISREIETTGVLMFVRLFEDTPELLNLFTKFQELKTKDKQMKSMELAEHAKTVMTQLDEVINSMDDMDFFIEHLHSVGKLHRKIPGYKSEYFLKMEIPFLDAVKEVLQDRYTENMENIYKIIIKLILQTLVEGFEKDFD